MTDTQKYFIHLLSSHLNNTAPVPMDNPDWKEMFQIAEIHNLTGMLCLALKQLPNEYQPTKIMPYFNQAFAQTLINFEKKQEAQHTLCKILNDNNIRHIIIKGGALRELYPVPALRTSGDIDVIVDNSDFDNAADILIENGFINEAKTDLQCVIKYLDTEIELKNHLDHIKKVKEYTDELNINNIYSFDDNFKYAESIDGCTYYLYPTYHLHYLIAHMLSHIKDGGAGLRQLMDIHILISNCEIDYDKLLQRFEKYNITKSGLALLCLAKEFFGTNIPIDISIDDTLREKLLDMIVNGGVFGFNTADSGTVRVSRNLRKNKLLTFLTTFLRLFIVSKKYLYNLYEYADKHHILLPIAYVNRLFDAVFKRGRHNAKVIKSMYTNQDQAIKINELVKELDI